AERTRHALAVRVPGDAPLQWRLPRFIDLTWLAQVFENLRATGHTAAMAVRIPAPARSLRSDTAEERQAPPSQDPPAVGRAAARGAGRRGPGEQGTGSRGLPAADRRRPARARRPQAQRGHGRTR